MTNKDYFISLLGFAPGPNVAEAALIDAGITGSDTYVITNRALLLPFVIRTIRILLSTADTTNSTTGFSIRYDRDAIEKLALVYEDELDVKATPTIRGRQVW